MSCQAIQQNGVKCGNTAKKEYDHKYCGKHIKVWIELQNNLRKERLSSDNDKIKQDLTDIKQQLIQGLQIIRRENEKTRNHIEDVVMKEADDIHDTIIGETRHNRIMINDNISFQIMAFYHNLYARNRDSLSTFDSVNDKLIDILNDQNQMVLKDLRSSKHNHHNFLALVDDFTKYLPTDHKRAMVEQVQEQLRIGMPIF